MKSGKKLLSLILALCMVLSVIGVAAFAADTESSEPVGDQPVALSVPNAQDLKGLVEKYFGSTQVFANFVADTVGRIVTGTKSDHLAEVIVNAFENGIIIGDISQMTDEEVKVMLDQIYWVYADNPGPITQTVDCIKMFVNWCDASIHRGQDGPLLGTMQKKLATYYWNWLKENCSPEWWDPDRPTDPTDPTVEPTDPTDPTVEPTDPTDPTVEPTDPTDPTVEPTDPTDPTVEPTDPTDPTVEPTDPTDPTVEPTDPTDPTVEPTDPTDPIVEPTDPTDPTVEPTDPTDPIVEPTDPTDPTVEPTKPAEPTVVPTEPTGNPTEPTAAPTGQAESTTEQGEIPSTGEPLAIAALVLVSAAAATAVLLTRKKGQDDSTVR